MKPIVIAVMLFLMAPAFSQSNSLNKMKTIVIQQVNAIFAGADERNWNKTMSAMDKDVLIDYSSMTGAPGEHLTPEQITTRWAAFLPGFDRTNHKLSDFNITINGNDAVVHYIGKADHYLDGDVWTVEGRYETALRLIDGKWLTTTHIFHFDKQSGNTTLPGLAVKNIERSSVTETNKKTVDKFFIALETGKYEMLKEVFAENGRQLNPYAPEGFPKSFDGVDAIYNQYSGLAENFGAMKFPREIFPTTDPNFFFVKFNGTIVIKSGGKYENDYLGTFKFADGKVIEYTEYFNQIVMARAFGINLK